MKTKFPLREKLILILIPCLIVVGLYLSNDNRGLLRFYNQNAYAAATIGRIDGHCYGQVPVTGVVKISKRDGLLLPPSPPCLDPQPAPINLGTGSGLVTYTLPAYTNGGDTDALTLSITCDSTLCEGAPGVTTLAVGSSDTGAWIRCTLGTAAGSDTCHQTGAY